MGWPGSESADFMSDDHIDHILRNMLTAKQRKWLSYIEVASRSSSGMYPGSRVDHVPNRIANELARKGLIEIYQPHNPVHKDRWIITTFGLECLKVNA